MNRLTEFPMTAVSLLFLGVALLSGDSIGYTQQRSDSDNVKAAIDAFHAALSDLDNGKMQTLWLRNPTWSWPTRGTRRQQLDGMLSKETGTECSDSGRS
jgi:hypothetical protein